MNTTMNISLGFDKNYLPYTATTIQSILDNNLTNKIHFYLMINNSINVFDKFLLRKMIKKSGNSVEFINMQSEFKNLATNNWSLAMYYPLLLSSICSDDKVLFLDSDMIINGDLKELYDTNLDGYFCDAVRDYGMMTLFDKNEKVTIRNTQKINTQDYFTNMRNWDREYLKQYCNSGMLLLNLKEMREYNIEEKMLALIKEELLAFPDQDCINICCAGKIKLLPLQYNFTILHKNIYNGLTKDDQADFDEYLNSKNLPLIMHFLCKPWKRNRDIPPYKDVYYSYKNKTFWKFHLDKIYFQNLLRIKLSIKESYLYIGNKKIFHNKKSNSLTSSVHS